MGKNCKQLSSTEKNDLIYEKLAYACLSIHELLKTWLSTSSNVTCLLKTSHSLRIRWQMCTLHLHFLRNIQSTLAGVDNTGLLDTTHIQGFCCEESFSALQNVCQHPWPRPTNCQQQPQVVMTKVICRQLTYSSVPAHNPTISSSKADC